MADWKGTYRISNISVEESAENFTVFTDKLNKREEERQEKLKKKKDEDDSFKVQDSLQLFHAEFTKEKSLIETELNELGGEKQSVSSTERGNVIALFDNLSFRVSKLQRFVSESALFLPPYELKTAQNMLVILQHKIQGKRDEKLPKKKFAFRSNKKATKNGAQQSKKEENDLKKDSKSDSELVIELAACKFVGASGEMLKKENEEINSKDVALADLTDCTVLLYGAPSAVHISKLSNCKIFCGPVPGSIFIRDCINCTFVLACQQLRVHSTTDSEFYIHVTSKAIIEDCSTLKFAPYNWSYSNIDDHYFESGLTKERNNWDQVDDFNWLAADVHSPNWSIIEKSERITDWSNM